MSALNSMLIARLHSPCHFVKLLFVSCGIDRRSGHAKNAWSLGNIRFLVIEITHDPPKIVSSRKNADFEGLEIIYFE